MLRQLLTRVRSLFRRTSHAEIDAELQFHIDRETAANIASGMSPGDARRNALLSFGGLQQAHEACRESHPRHALDILAGDLRYALRGIRRHPAFSIAVVLTLMLGIGATTAVFSVVDRILFRALPYGDSGQLVSVGLEAPVEPQEFMLGGSYYVWRDNQKPFTTLTSEIGTDTCDLTEVNPVHLTCARVEHNFLSTLGVNPVAGRNFTADEDRPNAPRVALISYALWRSRYHFDDAITGKIIRLDNQATQIIGVLPATFEMPRLQSADILLPECLDVAAQRRADPGRPLWAFARLKPGVTIAQAAAELQPLFAYSLNLAPAAFRKEVHLQVRPLRDRQFHSVKRAAWMLLALVLSVLLIACANVTSLLLARRSSRERELAVRSALGAGRARLLRQACTEALVLSLIGAAAGAGFAELLLRIFIRIAPQGLPFLASARIDLRILAFSLVVSLLSAAVFGVVSGLRRVRPDALTTRAAVSSQHARLRQSLVTAQIAVSMLLLAGGALLSRSFWNLQRQSLGLNAHNIVTADLSLSQSAYPNGQSRMNFFLHLERNLRYGPGTEDLAVSDTLPPGGHHGETIFAALRPEGRPRFTAGTGGTVAWRWVTPDYFRTLQIPIVQGSGFTDDELSSPNRYVVLSSTLTRRLFPNENPIGRQLHLTTGASPENDPVYTITGIAADVKNGGLAAGDEPEFYRLRRNRPEDWNQHGAIILRTSLPAVAAKQWMRTQIAALDPTLPANIVTLQEQVGKLADQPRFEMLLVGFFACTGLVLAVVGLYGVVAFLVVQRKPEIGVRLAVGASRADIIRLVLATALRMTIPGVLIGLLLALFLSRALSSLLFQVPAHDPANYLAITAALLLAALAAAFFPALTAARTDPNTILRVD